VLSVFLSILGLGAGPLFAFVTNQDANIVIGQSVMTTGAANQGGTVDADTLNSPRGIFYLSGKLLISDRANHRVLIFNSVPGSYGAPADLVIGQIDLTSGTLNQGGAVTANTLYEPAGICMVGTSLVVADYMNHRVLIYNSMPSGNNAAAAVVIGQSTMGGNTANQGVAAAANTLNNPYCVTTDGTRLLISDEGNNRVLIYNTLPAVNNTAANVVIGQATMAGNTANQGGAVAANTLSAPRGIYFDGTRLIVTDYGNNRVLIYNSIPAGSNANANFAVGQPDLVSNIANNGGLNASSLSQPSHAISDGTNLYVSDSNNNRILIYTPIPTIYPATASVVLGQPNMNSNTANNGGRSSHSLSNNRFLCLNGSQLLVNDAGNNRALVYQPASIYRSIGPGNTTPLAAGAGNLTISGITATFTTAVPNNVGVGDAIQYDADNNGTIDAIAFICGRTDGSNFTVRSATGTPPTATTAANATWGIYRAYTSLFNVQSATQNTGIDAAVRGFYGGAHNLVTSDEQWHFACYGDNPDTAAVNWAGWTTDATHYIRFFTPYQASEVGTSQRHTGIWTAGAYQLVVSNSTAFSIADANVRLEGLQIQVASCNATGQKGIYLTNMTTTADLRISGCIIRGVNTAQTYHDGISLFNDADGTEKIWNNIIYGFRGNNTNAGIEVNDLQFNTYAYNNTIVNCGRGIWIQSIGSLTAINNVAQTTVSGGYVGAFAAASGYNVSGLADCPGSNPANSATVAFVNAAGNDYHLNWNDTAARNTGVSLAADANLAFNNDIDMDTRPNFSVWDRGADEDWRPTPTPTNTATPTATATVTTTPTGTPTATASPTATPTFTITATPTATATASDTPTATPTYTATATPTVTATATPTYTATATPTATPTATDTPTATATATATPTATSTMTPGAWAYIQPDHSDAGATQDYAYNFITSGGLIDSLFIDIPSGWFVSSTPVSSVQNGSVSYAGSRILVSYSPALAAGTFDSITLTATAPGTGGLYYWSGYLNDGTYTALTPATKSQAVRVNTLTATPSMTGTATATATATATVSMTTTPTATMTATATMTRTVTMTPTASPTMTATPTLTPSATPTSTATGTATGSATTTATATASATATATPTCTASATATATMTVTSTATSTSTSTTTPTMTPGAQAFIQPTVAIAGQSQNYEVLVVSNSDSPITSLQLTIPNGWYLPSTPASMMQGGVVSYAGDQILVSYAVPWSTGAFDSITLTATAPGAGGVYYWSTYLNNGAYQAVTPSGKTQTVLVCTATLTATDTCTPTATLTASATLTATATSTATGSMTATNTPTLTGTVTATPSATLSVTSTPSPTATDTLTATASITSTMTGTVSATPSASATQTQTATVTPTATCTATATNTAIIPGTVAVIYRSVGPANNTALATGAGNLLTVLAGTASLAAALPNNVGVGDVIQYDSNNDGTVDALAFITSRTDGWTFSVRDATGRNNPPDTVGGNNTWSAYRAYTALANVVTGNENAGIDPALRDFDTGNRNLYLYNEQWNIACYADAADTTPVVFDNWFTTASDFIRIYTPYQTAEVGASQRHAGVWSASAYRIQAGNTDVIKIGADHVRLEGLQIWNNVKTAAGGSGLWVAGPGPTVDIRISSCLIRGVGNTAYDNYQGIVIWGGGNGEVRIWNNIIYDFNGTQANVWAINHGDDHTVFVYNNTIANCRNGMTFWAGTMIAKNNLVQDALDGYSGAFTAASDYNLSNVALDAPGIHAKAGAVLFADKPGSNYHLAWNDNVAKAAGVSLGADPDLAFANDVDGEIRSGAWDIGADQDFASTPTATTTPTFTVTATATTTATATATGTLTSTPTITATDTVTMTATVTATGTAIPSSQAYIQPAMADANQTLKYNYNIIAGGGAVDTFFIDIPAGWYIPDTPVSTIQNGTVAYNGNRIMVSYASPLLAGSFDSVTLTATAPGIGGLYFWSGYMNDGAYVAVTPATLSQAVAVLTLTATPTISATLTATVTVTVTPTMTPSGTATLTATVTGTASATATLTATASVTATPTASETITSTDSPTATMTPTDTGTETSTPSETATPTASETVTSTDSPTATMTPTSTDSPTETLTATSTSTSTPTPSQTPTATESASATSTPTDTASATVTPTFTESPVFSPTDTASVTVTPTVTATLTATETGTATVTLTATPSFTVTATVTPAAQAYISPNQVLLGQTQVYEMIVIPQSDGQIDTLRMTIPDGWAIPTTPSSNQQGGVVTFSGNQILVSYVPPMTAGVFDSITLTATAPNVGGIYYWSSYLNEGIYQSVTPATKSQVVTVITATATITPTATGTATVTPTMTATMTGTPTVTLTATETATATATGTLTATGTPTLTFTETATATATGTQTATVTPTATPTGSPTATVTSTQTPTGTPTSTSTATATATASSTPTATATATMTSSGTATGTATATATATPTATSTVTSTPTSTATATVTSTFTASRTYTSTPTMTATGTITPTATMTATFTQTSTSTASPTITMTITPAADAYILPNSSVVNQTKVYEYNVIAGSQDPIQTLYLAIPSGWSLPTTPSSNVQSGTVTYSGNSVMISYSTPWAAGSYDTITLTATAPNVGGIYYWNSYLNNGAYQARTATSRSQMVVVGTATVTTTSTVTPTNTPTYTITPTQTITLTITQTPVHTSTPSSTVTATPSVTVTPTATATPIFQIMLLAPSETLSLGTAPGYAGSVTSTVAGYPVAIHLYAMNLNGYSMLNRNDTIRISYSGDPAYVRDLPDQVTLQNGQAVIYPRFMEPNLLYTLSAQDIGNALVLPGNTRPIPCVAGAFAPNPYVLARHTSLAPNTAVEGETDISMLSLTLTNPNAVGSAVYNLQGLTLTVESEAYTPLAANSLLQSVCLVDEASGQELSRVSAMSAASSVYIPLTGGQALVFPQQPHTFRIRANLLAATSVPDFRLAVQLPVHIASQFLDSTPMLVQPDQGDAFAMSSGDVVIRSHDLKASYINYPNPFAAGRQNTAIEYYLEHGGRVSLKIYNIIGQPVRVLTSDESQPASTALHRYVWDGRNGSGQVVLNGLYFAVLTVQPEGGGKADSLVLKIAVVK
jgi:hypothetical protein